MMVRPRWIAHLIANVLGYFWLPCPLCGEMFAGFEWLPGNSLMVDWSLGQGVCPNCGDQARTLNAKLMSSVALAVESVGQAVLQDSAPHSAKEENRATRGAGKE